MFNWILFNYESGGNPYIAKTEAEALRIVRRNQGYGYDAEYLGNGVFLIHDEKEVKTACAMT